MKTISVAKFDALKDRKPEYALVGEVDLVGVRIDDAELGTCLGRDAKFAAKPDLSRAKQ